MTWRKTLEADRSRRLRMAALLCEEIAKFPEEYGPTPEEMEQFRALELILRDIQKKWRKRIAERPAPTETSASAESPKAAEGDLPGE